MVYQLCLSLFQNKFCDSDYLHGLFFSYFPTPPSDCLFVICYIQSTLAGQSRFLLSFTLGDEEERALRGFVGTHFISENATAVFVFNGYYFIDFLTIIPAHLTLFCRTLSNWLLEFEKWTPSIIVVSYKVI